MSSINGQLACDIKDMFVNSKEVEMSLRFRTHAEISVFIRNNKLQKFTYDEFDLQPFGSEEDDEFDGMPKEVYTRLCNLIYASIKDFQVLIEYGFINIQWSFDAIQNEIENISVRTRKEIHCQHR
ncbi:hypothetical protein [Viridibacillus arvi]|uniref:hypothetical protein n=1 Tax=Viridibacillus arvi TaxID=263475 RepID=UPI0034CF48EC